jgi:hypothetical protein
MKKKLLFLDDTRNPLENDWLNFSPIGKDVDVSWVMSYQEFINWIIINGLPDGVCFDHDLGYDIDPNSTNIEYFDGKISCNSLSCYNDNEKTGYDCAKWLIHYCEIHNKKIPKYNIQSSNPVGKENIDCLLKNYIKHCELSD